MSDTAAADLRDVVDVLVVGAGPVGIACGVAARRAGLASRLVEKGCIVNSVFHFPRAMVFFTTPELMEVGGHPLISGPHGKPTRGEALDYYRCVARVEQLDIRTDERVITVRKSGDLFTTETRSARGERLHASRRVIIATGYHDTPNRLGIPGEDSPHVSHYYGEAHPFAGKKVLVVGGKNSACEAALDLFRHDADVTLAHRGDDFGSGVKYWVLPDIQNRIAQGHVRAWFRTEVESIAGPRVRLRRDGASFTEEFDQVFLLTGYVPDADLLRSCGLEVDARTLETRLDAETLECADVPGIHLAGGVRAGRATGTVFIENGRHDAERIIAHIAGALRR